MASPEASEPKVSISSTTFNYADITGRHRAPARKGGAEVVLVGFHRKAEVDTTIAKTEDFVGPQYDGAFVQRILSVFARPSSSAAVPL